MLKLYQVQSKTSSFVALLRRKFYGASVGVLVNFKVQPRNSGETYLDQVTQDNAMYNYLWEACVF